MSDLKENIQKFMEMDMLRRTGAGGDSIQDRNNEGPLMASLLGPMAPMATLPVGLAGAAYEGVKGIGQATGIGKLIPGPFKQTEETSPASFDNVKSLMGGFTNQAGDNMSNLMQMIKNLVLRSPASEINQRPEEEEDRKLPTFRFNQ